MGLGKLVLIIVALLAAVYYFAPDKFDDGRDWTVDKAKDLAANGLNSSNSASEQACLDAGGAWETFLNSCADVCDPSEVCLDILTESCNCGDGQCWDEPDCIAK